MCMYGKLSGRDGIGNWSKRGSTLPAVLVVIVVLSLLGAALLSITLLERQSTSNAKKICQAGYLAEAGLNLALAHLRREPDWRQGIGPTPLPWAGGEIVEVSVIPQVMSYRLRSTAAVGGISQTLELELARPFSSYALASAGSLALQNTVKVNGDMFSQGSVWLPDGAAGNVIAAGDITNRGIVQGSVVCGGYLFNSGTIKGEATVGGSKDRYGNDPNYYGLIKGLLNKGLAVPLPAWPDELVEPYYQSAHLSPGEYTLAEIQGIINGLPGEVKIIYCGGDLAVVPAAVAVPEEESLPEDAILPEEQNHYHDRAIIAVAGDVYLGKNIMTENVSDAWAFIAGEDLMLEGGITVDAVLACAGYFYKQGAASTVNGSLLAGGIDMITTDDGGSNKIEQAQGQGWIKGRLTINYNSTIVKALAADLTSAAWQALSWRQASLY